MINACHVSDAVPAAMISIFALWALGSTWHWFVRTCLVGAALFFPLLIPAHEVVIQFGIQILTIVCGLIFWRFRQSRDILSEETPSSNRPQVSLKDALLLTAVLAVNLTL